MYRIVEHVNYDGMPCTVDDEGKIDWSIPSNRKQGSKNWDGNRRRRAWWRQKADELGVETQTHWISKAAKALHPFGEKPCQTCGRVMKLSYVYPTARAIGRINQHLPSDAQLDPLDLLDIYEIIDHVGAEAGLEEAVEALNELFPVLKDTDFATSEALKEVVAERVVPSEPRGWLSPGAMSNAPDRLDGFHSYNLCCRSKQDTARTSENLKSYGVDRRAFEHWSEGDWSAANALMNAVTEGECARCGTVGALTADHVGPISLGFRHSPQFEAVCLACNSAKNNRMSLVDVERLRELEQSGEEVVSWHAKKLWDTCKEKVESDEQALLLSRLLRANQHHYLLLLHQALERAVPEVLLQFLSPEYANERTEFEGLNPATLQFDRMIKSKRQGTYARSHGARMVRIAFSALTLYVTKTERKVYFVDAPVLEGAQSAVDAALAEAARSSSSWREELREILALDPAIQDIRLAQLFRRGYKPPEDFGHVREAFASYMDLVAEILARRFDEGRAERFGDAIAAALGDV